MIRIYDPVTNTVATGPAATGYSCGALLPDGRVLLVPATATVIRIYNPATDTVVTGPSASGYFGGVLLPDGRVVLCPSSTTGTVGIYLTNTPAPADFCLHPCFNKM